MTYNVFSGTLNPTQSIKYKDVTVNMDVCIRMQYML